MHLRSGSRLPVFLVLLIVLSGTGILALCTGATFIPIREIISILTDGKESTDYTILMHIRMPRIILGFAVGGSLSLAGALLQGMFRNPLVEPYTLGISGGASLGVALNILFKWYAVIGTIAYPVSGFIGALMVMFFVYGLSVRQQRLGLRDILLIGVMVSFIASSVVMLLMAISKSEDLHGIIFWIMGSLDEPNLTLIYIAVGVSLGGLLISHLFCLPLNALSLGEEGARHLGIQVESTRRWLFLLASLLTGLSVSVAGIIGFVGLVVPHFMRMVVGPDHRFLLSGSFLAGAAFLILCDTLARTIISPLELPVGVVTGIIGGIVFVYALTRKRVVL
jgi:iron complex transport system permease protein